MVGTEQDTHIVPVVIFGDKSDNQPRPYQLPWLALAQRLCKYEERLNKDGQAWSPVSYRPGTTRGKANVEWVHMLVLDVDHTALPLDLLESLEYVAHTTFSHSEADPRWRVVLPLATPIAGRDWPAFWLRANAHFGGCVDPATKDSSRIFYLPSCQPGGIHEVRQQHGAFLEPGSLPEVPKYEPPQQQRVRDVRARTYLHGWAERFVETKAAELAAMGKNTGRNDACNRTAYLLGGLVADDLHGLDTTWVAQALYGACERNGLVEEDGQRQTEATIQSGLEAGLTQPWSPADQDEPIRASSARANGHAPTVSLLDIVPFSMIEPEEVHWLWQGRIAMGKLTVLMGDPGLGKSLLTVHCAAVISTGGTWPDGQRCEAGDVIILTAEDGPADTVRPRLDAAGANVARVHNLRGIKENPDDETSRMFQLATDIDQLEQAVHQTHAKLVIIDPLNAYLGGVDSHKAAEVRGVLAPMAAMADRTGVGLLVLHHLNKGTSANALYRAGGSLDFVAAARSVLGVVPDPDQPARRLMVSVKINIATAPPGLGYRILSSDPLRVTSAPIIGWDQEPVSIDPATAFSGATTPEETWLRQEIESVLLETLKDGEAPADGCKSAVRAAVGTVNEGTLRSVRNKLGIRAIKRGFGAGSRWVWGLPAREDVGQPKEVPSYITLASSSSLDDKEHKEHKEHKGDDDTRARATSSEACRWCGRTMPHAADSVCRSPEYPP